MCDDVRSLGFRPKSALKQSQMYIQNSGIITGMTVRVEILRVCSWWKCDHSEPSICISFVHVVPIKGTSPS
jgi:hypothetical protein